MELDVSEDWRIFDWLQEIQYQSRLSPTTWGSNVSMQALKRENNKESHKGNLLLNINYNEAIWSTWVSAMSSPVVPKIGDRFTAVGVTGNKTWNVLGVDYCDRTTRYRLHCKQGDNQS